MKKFLLVLVSVLLLAGVAQAVEMNQAITSQLTAQNTGRSRTTDSSVVLKVWSGGALANPGVGVSANSVLNIFTSLAAGTGVTINVGNAATDTIGEVVDYINTNLSSDSSVKIYAAVGADAYRDMPAQFLTTNVAALGSTKDTAATVATSSSRLLSAGVEAKDGVTPRIKSVQCNLAASVNNAVTLTVYDSNTAIYRRLIGPGAYNSSTADGSSANSVVFPSDKGLSATKGNSIVAVATTDANVDGNTWGATTNAISIVYDQYRD